MAVEDILKNSKKRTKKVRKHIHGVNATDERYTGTEPVWDGCESWGPEKFNAERSRNFNFYNYYLSAKESKPRVLEWMAVNGYSKEDIHHVRSAPDYYPGMTTASLCTAMLRGMPAKYPGLDHDDLAFVRDRIKHAIGEAVVTAATEKTVSQSPSVSPMIFLQDKTRRTIIMDLDVMLDRWVTTDKAEPLDMYASMTAHGLSAMACAQVERWIERHLLETKAAYEKTDDYLVEVYRNLTRNQQQSRIEAYEKMLEDLNRFKHAAKATRQPREKKPVAATKQISKLQYCKESSEFKIASINPARIVGAYRVLAFNVKYRVLLDYVAQNEKGLSIKGTTLQNVDDSSARAIRLRKPDEFLPIVLSSTAKQLEKAWSNLTTKESKPKPRINNEVVLLRVFEKRDK